MKYTIEEIEIEARELAERVKMLWEFQTPVTFQDKMKAEGLLERIDDAGLSQKRKR